MGTKTIGQIQTASTGNIINSIIEIESGGVSYSTLNGGIIESGGDDTDGRYIKYGDGTMMQWVTKTYSGISINTLLNGVYYCPSLEWTYPVLFNVAPVYTVGAQIPGSVALVLTGNVYGTTSNSSTVVGSLASLTNQTVVLCISAIGRWKA